MEKIIVDKIAELKVSKTKMPWWKRWWVQKIIEVLEDLLYQILSKRHEEENVKNNS